MRPVQAWAITIAIVPCIVILMWIGIFTSLRSQRKDERYTKVHLPVSIIITLLFAHPVITKSAVKLIACRDIADRLFLDADFMISCNSLEYSAWVGGLGIPMLVLFTFGVPAMYFYKMYRLVRAKTLQDQRDVYGFFFSGFRKGAWWFELWNTMRKSMFTVGAVLFAPAGVMMQTWVALVMLLVFVVVFSLSQPYEQMYLNHLERSALSINVVTLLLGIGLFTNDVSDQKNDSLAVFITVCILFLNILFMMYVVYTLFRYSSYCSVCRKKNRASDEEDEIQLEEDHSNSNVVIVPIEPPPPQVVQVVPGSDAHIYAALKLQRNMQDAVQHKKNGKHRKKRQLKRQDTVDVANMVVKSAALHVKHKLNNVEKERRSSLTRLKSRLDKRKSNTHNLTAMTTDTGKNIVATTTTTGQNLAATTATTGKNLATPTGKHLAATTTSTGNGISETPIILAATAKPKTVTPTATSSVCVEEIRSLLIAAVKSSDRLRKIFIKFSKQNKSVDQLDRKYFELIVTKIIGQQKGKKILFLKNETWISLQGSEGGETVEFSQMSEWLGFLVQGKD